MKWFAHAISQISNSLDYFRVVFYVSICDDLIVVWEYSAWDMLLHGHTFVVAILISQCVTHVLPVHTIAQLLGFLFPCIYFLVKFHLLMAKVISVAINCNHHTDKDQVRT
jgi:hypothetical protein